MPCGLTYEVIGYHTVRYQREELREQCKGWERVVKVVEEFLSKPGRKVKIYLKEKNRKWRSGGWGKIRLQRVKIHEATTIQEFQIIRPLR